MAFRFGLTFGFGFGFGFGLGFGLGVGRELLPTAMPPLTRSLKGEQATWACSRVTW